MSDLMDPFLDELASNFAIFSKHSSIFCYKYSSWFLDRFYISISPSLNSSSFSSFGFLEGGEFLQITTKKQTMLIRQQIIEIINSKYMISPEFKFLIKHLKSPNYVRSGNFYSNF